MIFDVPRITTTLRDSISDVVNSSVIYNTTENRYEYYDGSAWRVLGGGSGGGSVLSFNTRTGDITLLDSDIASLGDFTVSGTLTIDNNIILGSQALKLLTSSTDPNVSGVSANTGSIILKTDGSLWQKLGSGNTDWSQIQTGEYTNEPTGFPIDADGEVDRTSSTISFVGGSTRTFTIAPTGSSYTILVKGRQFRKTTSESIQISNTQGAHYIYFDENGQLHETTSFSLDYILKYVAVAIIYWDSSVSQELLFGDERHGCTMDSHTHARLHADGGAVYVEGMSITDLLVNNGGNSELSLTFGVTQGSLRDEDILHDLPGRTINQSIRVIYREGTEWRFADPTNVGGYYARAIGSSGTPGVIAYNYNNNGTWSRVSISNNHYVLYHLVATNDYTHPYILIMGTNQYANKSAGQAGSIVEIGTLTGLPFSEMTLVATMMYIHTNGSTNSLKAQLSTTDTANYEDWRFAKTLNPTTAAINNHNNLGGIYGGSPFYHSDQPIGTTDSVIFHAISSSTTLDVSGTSTLATTNMSSGNVSGALNVTGTSTQSTVNLTTGNVSGALNVTGTSTLATTNMSTANVSGALNVTGTSTQSTVNLTTGNVSGALNVTGTSTQSTVNMTTGNISGTLNVTGTSTQSTVNMTTANTTTANVSGALNVTGTSTQSTVNMTTANTTTANVTGALNVTGTSTLATTNMTNSNVSGALNVTGTSNLATVNLTNGNLSGNLNVTGTSTQSTINMTNGNVSGALTVTGTTHLTTVELDSLTASTINNTGNLTVGSNSGNTVTINSNAISIPNGLNFDSNTLIIDATNNRIGINKTPTVALDVAGATYISGDLTASGTSNFASVNMSGSLVIGGNLTVNGNTTTVNSVITIIEDPIIVLGKSSPITDDNKDRGISFNYHNGTSAKVGYFGYQDSTGKFIFIPDATITGEVVSGSKGIIDATVDWSNLTSVPDYLLKIGGTISGNLGINGTLNVTGTSTQSTINMTTGNVSGALNVTGTSTLATTNMTTGNISSGLNVTGTSALATTNMTTGNVSGALNVTGTSTLATVNMTTDNVSGNLNVTGSSNLTNVNLTTGNISGPLNVSGTSTQSTVNLTTGNVSGALNVTGASTLATTNMTTGNISGALNVTGTSTQSTVNLTTGNISGALNVTGTSTLATTNMTTGNISGALNVTGTSTQSTVNLTTGNVSGALNVTGTSTLATVNMTTANSTTNNVTSALNVTGTSTQSTVNMTTGNISGALNVTGTSTQSTVNLTTGNVSGALNVTGTSTQSTVNLTTGNVSGALNVTGTSTLATVNMTTANSTTNNVTGALNVTGTSTQSTVNMTTGNISGALNVTGTSTQSTVNLTTGNVSGALNVTGTSTQSTVNLTTGNVSGALNVTGTSTQSTVNMTTANISSALNATGTVTLNNIKYPTSDGTSGQVIKTDGNGNLSFTTVSSGGGGSSVTFTSSTDFALGSPIYFSTSGTWQLAKADLDTTCVQYVVSQKTGSGTISYTALSSGEITLTTGQWDAITNASGGLTTGTVYFLSSSIAGKISSNVGLIYAPVLRALSSTKAFVSLSINSIESGAGDTFYRETTTTVASTSSITLSYPPAGKAYVWLSIDGAIQSGNDFSLSGNTLTLGATVPTNTLIDVLYARSVLLADSNAINKMVAFSETVTGSSKRAFNLPSAPSGLSSCIVFVGGAIQDSSKFNISGNVLTMVDLIPVGVQLIAYILNSSGVSNSIDSFVTRQTYSLPTNGTVNISTIFGSQVSGSYRFFDISDPRISGTILLKHNGSGIDPDVRVDSNSGSVSITIDTASKLNVYIASNLVTFQNKTSNTSSLRIYREI